MLNKTLVAGGALTIVVGLASSTALAGPPVSALGPSGYLDLNAQWLQAGRDYTAYNPWWGGGFYGAGNFWLDKNWSLQADLGGKSVFSNYDGKAVENGVLGVHLDRRDPMRGLFGVFGGLAATNDYTISQGLDGAWFGGLEGQAYLGNFTLYGQAGYISQLTGYYGASSNYQYANWFAQATARYFPSPNTKLEATIGYISGMIWGPSYGTTSYYERGLSYSFEAEHQFTTLPFSVFARADGYSDPAYSSHPINRYSITGGIRIRFGQADSLMKQDREGATLKVFDFDSIGWSRWND